MAVADDARRNRWNHIARLNGGEWLARSAQMGEPRKQHRTDNCWWLQKTRRARFGPNARKRTMETFRCGWAWDRGRRARHTFSNQWSAPFDCAYGRASPKFSGRVEVRWKKDRGISPSRKRISSAGCKGGGPLDFRRT